MTKPDPKLYDDPNIRAIEAEITVLRELLIKKNHDYGSSAFERPYLDPAIPPEDAIMVRMSDKVNRIRHIVKNGAALQEETLEDTVRDLAGYCLLLLAAMHKKC